MQKIVLATGNPHKVEELRAIFAGVGLRGVELVGLEEAARAMGVSSFEEPHECGSTFQQNATIKALAYAKQTGLACLADDSGLEIEILGGKPGVISSHYCTDGREAGMPREQRDAANNRKVLMQMEEVPEERR